MKDFIVTNIDLSNPNLQPLSDDIGMGKNEILSILQSIQSKKNSNQFDENEKLVFEKLLTMSRKCNIFVTTMIERN